MNRVVLCNALTVCLILCNALSASAVFKSADVERQVGLFYFLWLGEHGRRGPWDITKILKSDPDAGQKPDGEMWGPWGSYHHWGEPLYGYYFSDDEWVVRRHMKLIMQADVDFLFFDTTNGPTYKRNAKLVMRVLKEYHDAGWKVPKVMFYTNTASGRTVRRLYDAVYRPGFAREVWYEHDGKPVIVAKEEECDDETRAFFTIVKSQWPNEPSRKGGWPWMDFARPQRLFEGEKVPKSVMNVSVAQHPQLRFGDSAMYGEKGNHGRAFHNGANDPAPGAWKTGFNFQEQWDRAHEVKPDIVLVTGWNEWIAGRWTRKDHDRSSRPIMFVDCANAEYSRDIEMMRGGYGDSYFIQLRDNVRRFKEIADDDADNPPHTAKRYKCFADSAMPRDHAGYGTNYVNRTQRNAPEWIEVLHDGKSVVFRVKTQKTIVGGEGEGDFMRILVDGKPVNSLGETDIAGDIMTLKVPRKALGLASRRFRFGFKFVDSTVPCKEPIDWYDHGVVEPLGRIEFIYNGVDEPNPLSYGKYVVAVDKVTHSDPGWHGVARALVRKHQASLVRFDAGQEGMEDLVSALAKLRPMYVCFVLRPESAGRAFVRAAHEAMRRIDDDPYGDAIWGIVTGYDAKDALSLVKAPAERKINSFATSMGGDRTLETYASGFASDERTADNFWIKRPGGRNMKVPTGGCVAKVLADALNSIPVDYFMTSGHATERNWQIVYNQNRGMIEHTKDARLQVVEPGGKKRHNVTRASVKVYVGAGNCLIGHVDARACMATAWMHTAGVEQFAGYTVPSWYGFMGWGVADLFGKGRYTLPEARFLTNERLLWARRYCPSSAKGLDYDRDVFAFYGDPKQRIMFAEDRMPYTVTIDGVSVTVTFTRDCSFPAGGDARGLHPVMALLACEPPGDSLLGPDGKERRDAVVTERFVLIPLQGDHAAGEKLIFTIVRSSRSLADSVSGDAIKSSP